MINGDIKIAIECTGINMPNRCQWMQGRQVEYREEGRPRIPIAKHTNAK